MGQATIQERLADGVPLTRLKAGERGTIHRIDDFTTKEYLSSLGVVPGVEIEVESVAPFHGPMMLRIGPSTYAVSSEYAHRVLVRPEVEHTLVLVGNPNCGKSTLFNALTGLSIETANYAGTTVEVHQGITEHHHTHLQIVDLPGIYSLWGPFPEEEIVRRSLGELRSDAMIVLLDSLNLARNLFLALQLIEQGHPLAVALNFTDIARRRRQEIDEKKLSELLGVPVVKITASTGQGVDELMHAVESARPGVAPRFGNGLERRLSEIASFLETDRAGALRFLEEPREEKPSFIAEIEHTYEEKHGTTLKDRLARERHGAAGEIASLVQRPAPKKDSLSNTLWHWSIHPLVGFLFLIGLALGSMGMLFWASNHLNAMIGGLWEAGVSPALKGVFEPLGFWGKVALWGFDSGLLAVLSTGIAYILPFFLFLGLLEDSGYYGSIVFLLDRLMHRFGLHGRSVISLMSSLGCNVPAILACRVLPHRRERFIAATLSTLVPCAPRIAVITGGVAASLGWKPALLVFVAVTLVIMGVGFVLNRLLPGKGHGVVMEMFPLRRPNLIPTLKKTWNNFKEFITMGMPLVVVGCILLGTLYESHKIWLLEAPLRPLMEGWLGIPAIAGLTLIFAFLRKEMALQLLLTFAIASGHPGGGILSIMSGKQLIIFTLVNTLYIPCISALAALGRVMGWKDTAAIATVTMTTALLIGGLANLFLR